MRWRSVRIDRFSRPSTYARRIVAGARSGPAWRSHDLGVRHGLILGERRRGLPDQVRQVATVVIGQTLGELFDLRGGDEPHPERHLLDAGDLQTLTGFDGRDVVCGLDQRLDGAGIEPGESSTEDL